MPPDAPPVSPSPLALRLLNGSSTTQERYSALTSAGRLYAPERRVVHAVLLDEPLAGAHGSVPPSICFMAGGSASGKSRLAGPLRSQMAAVGIDPDWFKRRLPEFETFAAAGDPYGAAALHDESSDLAAELLRRAQARRLDIVVDATGDAEPGKFVGKLRAARDRGYDVSVIYADVPISLALQRNRQRAKREDRLVPEGILRENHALVAARFAEVEQLDFLARLAIYRTDTGAGLEPELIAERIRGESMTIHSPAKLRAFRAKAKLA